MIWLVATLMLFVYCSARKFLGKMNMNPFWPAYFFNWVVFLNRMSHLEFSKHAPNCRVISSLQLTLRPWKQDEPQRKVSSLSKPPPFFRECHCMFEIWRFCLGRGFSCCFFFLFVLSWWKSFKKWWWFGVGRSLDQESLSQCTFSSKCMFMLLLPIPSMYGIVTYIWLIFFW